jgi:hypothetical protein
MKPRLLPEIVVLLCIFNLAGFVFVEPKYGLVGSQILFGIVITSVSFVAIWRFWHGSRLSRILVLITSGIALVNLFTLGQASAIQKAVIIAEALFAVFLIYWLFTLPVRQYFAAGPRI